MTNSNHPSSSVLATVVVVAIAGTSALLLQRRKKAKRALSQARRPTLSSPEQVLNVILQRRSIFPKQYSGKAVERAVIEQMLEAARWAPTHHVTQPWEFVVFESFSSKQQLGEFLADSYKDACTATGKPFLQKKFDKKRTNATKASHIIAIIVHDAQKKNPFIEEVASVSMAVQNMFLVATAHGLGAYWSSGGVYDKTINKTEDETNQMIQNPDRLRKLLHWDDESDASRFCLGWVFVGDYFGDETLATKSWPLGRRSTYSSDSLSWR